MKKSQKILSAILSLVLILSIFPASVLATVEECTQKTISRGSGGYVTGNLVQKSTEWNVNYCVNLKYSFCTIEGIPTSFTNIVNDNGLVFRSYTDGGIAASNAVNFRYALVVAENCRKYASYYNSTIGAKDHGYKVKCSLSSDSASSSFTYKIYWNP